MAHHASDVGLLHFPDFLVLLSCCKLTFTEFCWDSSSPFILEVFILLPTCFVYVSHCPRAYRKVFFFVFLSNFAGGLSSSFSSPTSRCALVNNFLFCVPSSVLY